ncbi:MAG TPA: glycosyltransferase family 4 protein [Pyrinomonadaceae bacterium]|jgi:glycosyltransferase involved in cell wall biosynthesis
MNEVGTMTGHEEATRRAQAAVADAAARPVRVLIVAPALDILGGQAVQAARLLEQLRAEPSLAVGFLPINPAFPRALRRWQNVKVVRSVRTTLLYWLRLLREVRRYDVLHVFSASYLSFYMSPTPAVVAGKLFGKRVVLNYRSGEAEDHLRRWPLARRLLRLPDVIVVPSGYLVEVFGRFGLAARAVYNIVATERFRFRARTPLRPVFFANRNFEPMYNVACVLRAFAIVQAQHPAARLTVAGDGSQRGALEQLARELKLMNVEFVGRVAPERMHEFYDAADIYLNASDIDNMPGSIIEAYAAGLPVVTTDAGGIPYILTDGETGLLVRRGDAEALAAAALRLLADEALAARLTEQARRACERYSWAAVRGEWLKLYHELARGAEAAEARERVGG